MDNRVTLYDKIQQRSRGSHPLIQIIFCLNNTLTGFFPLNLVPELVPNMQQFDQTCMLTENVLEHMLAILSPESSRLDRAVETLGLIQISHKHCFREKLLTCFLRASVLSESAWCRCILYSRVRNTCKALLLFYTRNYTRKSNN